MIRPHARIASSCGCAREPNAIAVHPVHASDNLAQCMLLRTPGECVEADQRERKECKARPTWLRLPPRPFSGRRSRHAVRPRWTSAVRERKHYGRVGPPDKSRNRSALPALREVNRRVLLGHGKFRHRRGDRPVRSFDQIGRKCSRPLRGGMACPGIIRSTIEPAPQSSRSRHRRPAAILFV